jgi:hypothetical protein
VKRSLLGVVIGVLGMASSGFADITDFMLNVNGTTYCPSTGGYTCTNSAGLTGIAGLSSTLDTSLGGTGLGNVSLTFNPGAGNYNVNLWLFEQLFPATAQNEYGATGGTSLAAGESWQIDVPDGNYGGELGTAGAGSIVANTAGSTLSNTNYVPGTQSNFDTTSCGYFTGGSAVATCNDYTSMALGYNFTLAAGQEEVLNFTVSTSAPTSGFYLEQIAPVDPANPTQMTYYYSATAVTQPVGVGAVPEPSYQWILGAVAAVFVLVARRRSSVV